MSSSAGVSVKTPVAGQVTSSAQESATRRSAPGAPKVPVKERTPDDLRRIDSVKKVMLELARTVRSFTLYNQNNQAIQQFISNLFDSLSRYLEEETVLSVRIRQDSMFFEEELVYENSNRDESIALKLYKDGIKELVFQRGLEKTELVELIEIFNLNLEQPEFFDTDLVSIMWEKDWKNISYFVVEGFSEDLDAQKREEIEQDIELILSLVHSDQPPERALRSANLSKNDLYEFFKRDDLEEAQASMNADEWTNKFLVKPQELKSIQDEMEKISDADLIFQMVDIILNILSNELNHESFLQIGDVLVQILDMLLLRSDFATATMIIKRLREMVIRGGGKAEEFDPNNLVLERSLARADQGQTSRVGAWIEQIIERLGEEQRVNQVVTSLNQGFKGKPTEIFEYIVSLNATSVTAIINVMGDVSSLSHRRLICDAILIIHDGDITKFAQKLYDERWYVVSDMLYLLGKVGHADAMTYMMKACEHENPKVRAEALAALRRFPLEKTRTVFIHALRDENLQVQLTALRVLAAGKDHGAVDQVLAVVEGRDFADFPLSVKKRFFMTLASIEGATMVPFFSRTISDWRNLFAAGGTDMRICAAFALGIVGSQESLKILERYKGSWSKGVSDACREALQRAKTGNLGNDLILEPIGEKSGKSTRAGSKAGSGGGELLLEPIKKTKGKR